MAVEPQRASREDRIELRLGFFAVAGRDARGIQPEVDLRIVRRQPQRPLEQLDGRNAGLERNTGMAMGDAGVRGRETRSLCERVERVGMLIQRPFEKGFPLPQPGIRSGSIAKQWKHFIFALLRQCGARQLAQLLGACVSRFGRLKFVREAHALGSLRQSREG